MGANASNEKYGKQKTQGRGTVRNPDRLAAFASGSGSGGADWGGCDPERLQTVVVKITELGGAITFGLSRDAGAHSLTLMLDGSRQTLWFNGGADLNIELEGVADTLDGMG